MREQDTAREGRCSAGRLLSFWSLQLLRELKYMVPTQQGTESPKLTQDAVSQTEVPKKPTQNMKKLHVAPQVSGCSRCLSLPVDCPSEGQLQQV